MIFLLLCYKKLTLRVFKYFYKDHLLFPNKIGLNKYFFILHNKMTRILLEANNLNLALRGVFIFLFDQI
jgi:hypothetical protein